MTYARHWKRDFSPALAVTSRKDIALRNAGTTREELEKQIAAAVLCNIRIYRTAYADISFETMMRKLGGFTSMIETVIGPAPAAEENSIGMATSHDYWLWAVKTDLKEVIRQRVQGTLCEEYALQNQEARS